MYRFLLTRQWVLLTLVALLLIPAFVAAGNWQYQRYEQRVERNELISGNLSDPAVEITELTGVDTPVDPDDRFRTVTATGSYDTAHEVVVRQRTGPGSSGLGYYVLTPLATGDGPVVLVNRGWIPAGSDPTRMPDVPVAPDGEVTVSGRLMADETAATTGIRERGGLPDGMVMLISSAERSEAVGAPVASGHIELAETSPAPGGAQPELLPEPDHTSIGAHFAYALQWWFFTAMLPVGWYLLARREVKDQRAAAEKAERAAAAERTEPEGAAEAARPDGAAEPVGAGTGQGAQPAPGPEAGR